MPAEGRGDHTVKAYVTIFVTMLLAELGDKTQLATVLFAASPNTRPWAVFAAAAAALLVSTAAAVAFGAHAATWLPGQTLRTVAGVGFVAIGVWMLLSR